MKRAVFFDRDGVLNYAVKVNGRPYPPANVSELKILSGAKELLEGLKNKGFLIIVITNQPDVARGKCSKESVDLINNAIQKALPIDEFRTCFHDDIDNCACRKPKPGAIIASAYEHGINLSQSFMIGDRWRDVDAGNNAGCKTIFIDYQYSEKIKSEPTYTVSSLDQVGNIILGDGLAKTK